jgi:thymidine kinase
MATTEGSISLIVGPMFSEKTTEMVSSVRRAAHAKKSGVIIKWLGDTRYENGDVVAAHSELRQKSTGESPSAAPIRVISAKRLCDVDVTEDVVGVDEGQFYPDLIEACTRWAGEGRRVIIAALDGDYLRRPFGQVCDLIPLCEFVHKRRGVCMVCQHHESAFTQRINVSADNEVISVGGAEKYRSVCRECYGTK